MPTIKGGKKREMTNLELRLKKWATLPVDKQRATKRPGSNKK